MNKIKFLASLLGTLLYSAPVWAGAVTGWGAADGFYAVPVPKGTYIIDLRFNGGLSMPATSFALAPTVNFVAGILDGVEVGIGGGLNFSAPGLATNKTSIESVYPWIRAALPFSTDMVKTGFMVGSLIPVYQSGTPEQVGITGLIDILTGPLTSNLNFGYSRTSPSTIAQPAGGIVPSGDNILSGNINFTMPVGAGIFLYEEQYLNYPLSSFPNGGFRASAIFPFLDNKLTIDINPAFLWNISKTGTSWIFSPNIGASYFF